MSSETPPSIPPRKKPATDAGRSTSSTGSAGSTGTVKSGPAATATQPKVSPPSTDSASARPSTSTRTAAPATDERPAAATSSAARTTTPTAPAAAPVAAAAAPKPAAARTAAPVARPTAEAGPRRVRVAISRLDPWSVMKLAFLISVAIAIMLVVAAAVLWLTLDGLHVFAKINDLTGTIFADSDFDILEFVSFSRVLSGATLIAVIDIFLITALSTIGAFLYNITAALVGGVHVTMTDD